MYVANKTRIRASLERASRGEGPSVGQWLEFRGYSLARTIGSLGQDVGELRTTTTPPTPPVDPPLEPLSQLTGLQRVVIDCEHGNIDDNDMYLQVGAISPLAAP